MSSTFRVLSKHRVRLPRNALSALKLCAGDNLYAVFDYDRIWASSVANDLLGNRPLKVGVHHQITLPKAWCEELCVNVGDFIECDISGNMLELIPKTILIKTRPERAGRQTCSSEPPLLTTSLEKFLKGHPGVGRRVKQIKPANE